MWAKPSTVQNRNSGALSRPSILNTVGMQPVTAFVDKSVQMNEAGYIVAGEDCATNVPGVYAAGDIRTKQLRQIITAAADGANAVASVEKYIL